MPTPTIFPTPQDAEAAFYEAFERGDIESLMNVWADEDEVYCVLPGGPRINGHAAIRSAFNQIFQSGQRLHIQLSQAVQLHAMILAVHSLHEIISVHTPGGTQRANPVVATNIYQRSSSGWRMVAHHASPAPPTERPATRTERPRTLH